MGKRVKLLIVAGIAVGVLGILALHLFQDRLVRHMLESAIAESTGFDVAVDRIDSSLARRRIVIENLRLYNPAEFPDRDALDIERIEVGYFWSTLFRGRPWLRNVEVNVRRITVVQPASGPGNFDILNERIEAWQNASAAAGRRPWPVAWVGRPREAALPRPAADELWIGALTVRIAAFSVIDYRMGGAEPMRITQDIQVNESYTDVRDLDAVAERISVGFAIASVSEALGVPADALPPGFEGELQEMLENLAVPPATDAAPAAPVTDPEDQFLDIIDAAGDDAAR